MSTGDRIQEADMGPGYRRPNRTGDSEGESPPSESRESGTGETEQEKAKDSHL